MTHDIGTYVPGVQLVNIPAPEIQELRTHVNKQKLIVNNSRVIKHEINELSEMADPVNNTALDNLLALLDLIPVHTGMFRTSLKERSGNKNG